MSTKIIVTSTDIATLKINDLTFPGKGVKALTEEQERIRDLEKKLKDTEMERDILKKAMAIFSRTQ